MAFAGSRPAGISVPRHREALESLRAEWAQVYSARFAGGYELGHGGAAGRGIQDPPAIVAGGDESASDTGYGAHEGKRIGAQGPVAGMLAQYRRATH